jgi:hypothetical protein
VSFAEGALYRPLVWSVALALLASGALLSILMISAVVGPFRLAQLGKSDPRAVVALFRGADTPAGSVARTEFARELVGSGRLVREVTSLRSLDPSEIGAIVISEPRVLQDEEAAELRKFLAGGGGAVLVGSVGVRDADGAWLGYQRMRNLLGADVIPLDEDHARAIVANRRGPIAAALAPRQRIGIRHEEDFPGALVANAELSWTGPHGDSAAPAAALRREFGKGRLAWIAVGPERAATAGADHRLLRHVLEAAVAWCSRMPSVEVLAWPAGAPFAGVVEPGPAAATSQPELGWKREIDAAANDAGIAHLLVPSEARRHGDTGTRLAAVIGELERRRAWVATRSEISNWTRQRAVVDASVRRAGPNRIVVEVTNLGRSEASRVVLRVFINQPVLRATVEATELLQGVATVQLRANAELLDLVLPPLEPRSSAAFSIDYEPTPSQEG